MKYKILLSKSEIEVLTQFVSAFASLIIHQKSIKNMALLDVSRKLYLRLHQKVMQLEYICYKKSYSCTFNVQEIHVLEELSSRIIPTKAYETNLNYRLKAWIDEIKVNLK